MRAETASVKSETLVFRGRVCAVSCGLKLQKRSAGTPCSLLWIFLCKSCTDLPCRNKNDHISVIKMSQAGFDQAQACVGVFSALAPKGSCDCCNRTTKSFVSAFKFSSQRSEIKRYSNDKNTQRQLLMKWRKWKTSRTNKLEKQSWRSVKVAWLQDINASERQKVTCKASYLRH